MLAASVTALMASTLIWPPNRDAAKMGLIAQEIAHGRRPYADLVDMNYPGTHLVYLAGRYVFGTSYLAVRIQDLLLMAIIMAGAWKFLRPVGQAAALASLILIPWWYFVTYGLWVNFQRDWMIAAAAVWAACLLAQTERLWRFSAAGALMGFATTIRPTALIPAVALLVFPLLMTAATSEGDFRQQLRRAARRLVGPVVLYGITGACVVAGALLWVVQTGGWHAFVWLNKDYLPLYVALNAGGYRLESGSQMLWGAWQTYIGSRNNLLPWTLAIVVLAFRRRPRAMQIRFAALAAIAASGLLLGLLTNKGWTYQFLPFYLPALMILSIGFDDLLQSRRKTWLPTRYEPVAVVAGVGLLLAAIVGLYMGAPRIYGGLTVPLGMLVPAVAAMTFAVGDITDAIARRQQTNRSRPDRLIGITAVLLVFCTMGSITAWSSARSSTGLRHQYDSIVDKLVSHIKSSTTPEQSVFALDTASTGIASALMLAGRPLATSYVYDFYFFQDSRDPTIASMRESLMMQLREAPPELVVIANRNWAQRPDLTSLNTFPELASFLNSNYTITQFSCAATVLQRTQPSTAGAPVTPPLLAAARSYDADCYL